jgi:hypothetical protein
MSDACLNLIKAAKLVLRGDIDRNPVLTALADATVEAEKQLEQWQQDDPRKS